MFYRTRTPLSERRRENSSIQECVIGADIGERSTPRPVLARSSFLANISASIKAARFGSDQYAECACKEMSYFSRRPMPLRERS